MSQETELNNNLRATRSRLGVSQNQLAEVAGISRQSISSIEAGQSAPSASVALKLAKALGCRVEDLFWLEEDLPTVVVRPAEEATLSVGMRVSLARVGGRWIAHPLAGDAAFRTEMVPADGITQPGPDAIPGADVPVKLLDEPDTIDKTVVIAGCTPALSLWARSAERWQPDLRVQWIHANSMAALGCLARGEVHAAGLHLFDPASGEYNAPFVRGTFAGPPVVLVNLGVWEEGLLVRPGNPKGIRTGADLAQPGVRIVNRDYGAGARLMLDTLLIEANVTPDAVAGYEDVVLSHEEVAQKVAAGEADAGVSAATLASVYGLDFVPLRQVRYDLAILEEYLGEEPVKQLLGTLHLRWVRSQLRVLGGYDTSSTGDVIKV
jgi:putative molybdopterin biosynthesis protein